MLSPSFQATQARFRYKGHALDGPLRGAFLECMGQVVKGVRDEPDYYWMPAGWSIKPC